MRRWRNVSVAAASILLFFGGWFYSETNLLSNFDNVTEKDSEIIVSGSKAELILSGGERMILGKGQLDSVWMHEGMEVHSTEDRVSYVGERPCGKEGQPVELQYNILRVPRGGEYSVVLGDGTLVCLNSESELRYPVRGEGFFEVTEDPEHPFVVEVENARIEVLGTTFNVCGYAAEERVVTTLVEGMVRLSSESQSVILVPNEQGVLDKDGHLTKVEVFKDEETKRISFTGNMRRYDDFEQIVRMLEKTGGLIFNIEGRTIYITEK